MKHALTHYTQQAMLAAMAAQPQVSSTYLCHYDAGELKLDLYGEKPRAKGDEYIVTDACLTGTLVSLFEILSVAQLRDFSAHCEEHLPSAAEIIECSREDWHDAQRDDLQRLEVLGVGA